MHRGASNVRPWSLVLVLDITYLYESISIATITSPSNTIVEGAEELPSSPYLTTSPSTLVNVYLEPPK